MGAERVVRWGPPTLSEVVTDQLWRHGLGSADAVACARELAAAVGPAARASSFVDLGACRFLDGDISGALAAWQQAIVSGQTAPAARALFNLGLLHEHLGLYDEAIQRFEAAEAHGIAPYAAMATLGRARAQHRSGDHERAVATLARHADRLMEQDPDSPLVSETMLGLGDVAEEAGQLDRAEQAYRAAMTSDDETIRSQASLSLIDVLRFIGHDEEAQQIVEDAGLASADPVVALDRVELLIRLGRFNEAEAVLDDLATDQLGVADQFRLATIHIDLGRVNRAIDILEVLAGEGAAETRARAAYRLGEVYLEHDMAEPAATMFGNVRGLQPGYWADKASLALGDLAMTEGRHRIAAAHWADAAASRVESVSSIARERLVDAVSSPPEPGPVVVEAATDDQLVPGWVDDRPEPLESVDDGPATEAVDMVTVLDDEPLGQLPGGNGFVPGEITPVAGVLMALPDAEAVDVVIPAEPIAPGDVAPLEQVLPDTTPPDLIEAARTELAEAPAAPIAPTAPTAPTVVPLRRRSGTAATEAPVAEAGAADTPAVDGAALDVPHPPAVSAAAPTDDNGPVVIKLGRGRSTTAPAPAEPAAETVIDLRESDDAPSNPYADLAPEALDDDPTPSERNPYAELAPNFSGEPIDLGAVGDGDEPGPSTFSRFA